MSATATSWQHAAHVAQFDRLSRVPTWLLRRVYARFTDLRMVRDELRGRGSDVGLLDVGCATGELARYVRALAPHAQYTGCDVSRPALARAQDKYPWAHWRALPPDGGALDGAPFAVVVCRDVVHHQRDPWAFLEWLYAMTGQVLILRLRTRLVGDTVLDVAQSCQWTPGGWVPYLVLNVQDVMAHVSAWSPTPWRLTMRQSPVVLGGAHGRVLPAACADPATGTAETAVCIRKRYGSAVTRTHLELTSEPERLAWAWVWGALLRVYRAA